MYNVIKETRGEKVVVATRDRREAAEFLAWEFNSEYRLVHHDYEVTFYVEEKR